MHLWLLDLLPGDVKASQPKDLKLHPRLTLRELDVNDEAEMQFVESHGAGLFEVGVQINEDGGKRGLSETPFGSVTWIPV